MFAIALFAGAATAQRQSGAQVNARLTTGVVKLGGEVALVIEVSGAQNASVVSLPTVAGVRFGAISGPSVAVEELFVNGKRSRSRRITWGVPIQVSEKGEYTIPAVTVNADGVELVTRPVELKVVEDMQGEELGSFTIEAPKEIVEGQPFSLTLRFGWDTGIDGGINYANLSLPWLGALPGLLELDTQSLAQSPSLVELSLNKNDRVRAERLAETTINGRKFQLLEVKKRYLPTRPGKLEFSTSHFEFGQVNDSVFNVRGRESRTYFKRFPAFEIQVQRLPEDGRPLEYTGAVGTISAAATPDRRDVDAGDSIKLSVSWTGEGNLEFFDPPDPSRLDAFKDFRLFGKTDRKTADRRTVVYDLAPITPQVSVIPPIPLSVFDPVKKAYTVVATEPVPIRVRALANAASLSAAPGASATTFDIRDIQTDAEPDTGPPARPGIGALVGALLAVVIAWILGRALVRRRGDPDAPRARARRAARKQLVRELAGAASASQEARVLQQFLARRSGESAQAWIGRDPVRWAREHTGGFAEDAARDLDALLSDLDQRTYAGRDEALGAGRIVGVADRVMQGGL
jgi:hypothetical protein